MPNRAKSKLAITRLISHLNLCFVLLSWTVVVCRCCMKRGRSIPEAAHGVKPYTSSKAHYYDCLSLVVLRPATDGHEQQRSIDRPPWH